MISPSQSIFIWLLERAGSFADDERFDFLLSAADYVVDMDDPNPDQPVEYISDMIDLMMEAGDRPVFFFDFQGWMLFLIGAEQTFINKAQSIIDGTYIPPEDWGNDDEGEDEGGDDGEPQVTPPEPIGAHRE